MTSTIQEALDNALLSQAAYADFTGLDFSNELSLIEALINNRGQTKPTPV